MAIGRTAGRRGCTGRAWGLIARGAEGSLRLVKRQPELLVAQHEHWQDTYRAHPVLYGTRPSEPGVYAAEVFNADGAAGAGVGGRSWA